MLVARLKHLAGGALLFSFVLFTLTGYALMLECDLETLVKDSSVIISGKVIEKKSHWNEDKTAIYTDVIVLSAKSVKGDSPKLTPVRYRGGVIRDPDGAGIGHGVSDTPSFELYEEVFLFLNKDKGEEFYKVTAHNQGKFTVITDEKTGEKKIKSGAKILRDPETLRTKKVEEFTVPMEDMLKKVEDIIKKENKKEIKRPEGE